MTQEKPQPQARAERLIEGLLRLVCFISLPLLLLFGLTILFSLVFTGSLNTNVNDAEGFFTVFLTFSLPMVLALAAAPLAVQIGLRKRGAAELGLILPQSRLWKWATVFMAAGSAVLAAVLSNAENLLQPAFTVWSHFFFVAVAEEIMLRSVLSHELEGFLQSPWLLCLVNGIIFAFVYHSNDAFLPNLLVRVPLGFALCLVRVKSGSVYPAIALHWLYNMFVVTI